MDATCVLRAATVFDHAQRREDRVPLPNRASQSDGCALRLRFAADNAGRATLAYTWPALPAGLQLWAQAWMQDAGVWRSTRTLLGTSG